MSRFEYPATDMKIYVLLVNDSAIGAYSTIPKAKIALRKHHEESIREQLEIYKIVIFDLDAPPSLGEVEENVISHRA